MEKTFFIVDDDINTIKMLELIINKNSLGRVISQLDNGKDAVDEILFYNPDIVLIDLLLPSSDGIEIILSATKQNFGGKFIMISQVADASLVSKAYESGIVFFINKPINNIEVVNVINGVSNTIDLENSLSLIKSTLFNLDNSVTKKEPNLDNSITNVFTDIGILGTIGSNDLRKIIHEIMNFKKRNPFLPYQLQNIYEKIILDENSAEHLIIKRKALEQRIRRTIQKSFETIAELGCEDYYNSTFIEYATLLFDFKQVRQEMRHINNSTEETGKISTKRFIEGIITRLSNE
ncbi:MAG: response regulator [Clostridium sp.]|uniref:response regulator n=1 Tax=Clostridium sp. TaxID=1506 RepID=UPI00305103CD